MSTQKDQRTDQDLTFEELERRTAPFGGTTSGDMPDFTGTTTGDLPNRRFTGTTADDIPI